MTKKTTAKNKAAAGDSSLIGWVSDLAGQGVGRIGSMLPAPRVGDMIGGALQGAARTKATVDRNIQFMLAIANLPSKRDYQKLTTKLEALQGAVMNLTAKVDRLSSELGVGKRSRGNGKATSSRARTRTRTRSTRR